jgi:tol-pal system protein YbgF
VRRIARPARVGVFLWALAGVLWAGPIWAQDIEDSLRDLQRDVRRLEASIQEARRDLLVVQRTQAQTRATVEELYSAIQIVGAKLDEFNYRLRELAQRLDALQVGVVKEPTKEPAKPAPAEATVAEAEGPTEAEPIELEPPPTTAAPPPAPGTPPTQEVVEIALLDPREIFRAAQEDYAKGNYDLAILGFRDYLSKYPDTELASSAQFWLGESYMGKGDAAQAVEEFQKLLDTYPQSPKVPTALFKQALAYLELDEVEKARKALEKILKRYPTTAEAQQAAERLKNLPTPPTP